MGSMSISGYWRRGPGPPELVRSAYAGMRALDNGHKAPYARYHATLERPTGHNARNAPGIIGVGSVILRG
jgi:hypothetical protein